MYSIFAEESAVRMICLKKLIKKTVAALLTVATLASAFSFVSAGAVQSAASPLDYSDARSEYTKKVTPAQLIQMITGESVVGAELEYLNKYCKSVLLYSPSFSNDGVHTEYKDGNLYVRAESYSYDASNSQKVSFVPFKVALGASEAVLSACDDGGYEAVFEGVSAEDGTHIKIEYECVLTLTKEIANEIINYAYNDACRAEELREEHRDAIEKYETAYEKYLEYLEAYHTYEDKLGQYEEYLAKQAAYEREHAKYISYIAALADYERNLALYNQYVIDYGKYLEDKRVFEEKYNANKEAIDKYSKYLYEVERLNNTMAAFESIFTSPKPSPAPYGLPLGTLFSALQSKTLVSEFENNKELLIKLYGVKRSDIDEMSRVSTELSEMLNDYNEIRKTKDGQKKFEFYQSNYEEILAKFKYLYNKLDTIMTPALFNHICQKVDMDYEGDVQMATYKKWRMKNVMGHIYFVIQCLDDSVTAPGMWEFYKNNGEPYSYSFTELIAPNHLFADTNSSSPEGLSWPQKVEEVEIPKAPTLPKEVKKPLAPTPIDEPTAPDAVSEPIAPSEVAYPGDPPQSIELVTYARDILEAMENGELSKRNELGGDVTLSFYEQREKRISYSNAAIFTLVDHDYSIIYDAELDGNELEIPDIVPQRASSEAFHYSFSGWSLSPCADIPPEYTGEGDICLYARYSSEDRYYNVRWVVGNSEYTESLRYGTLPVCPISTELEPTSTVVYRFAGWNEPLDAISSDMTYIAVYDEAPRLYSVSFDVLGRVYTRQYEYGAMPSYQNYSQVIYQNGAKYKFDGWDKEFLPVYGDCVYTAKYQKKQLASAQGELFIDVTDGGYYITTSANEISCASLLLEASEENKRIEISFDEYVLTLDRAAVHSLAERKADKISFSFSEDGSIYVCVAIYSADEKIYSIGGKMQIKLLMDSEQVSRTSVSAVYGNALLKKETSYSGGYLSFLVDAGVTVRIDKFYTVSVSCGKNGTAILDADEYLENQKVSIKLYPNSGYEIDKIVVSFSDGREKITLTSLDDFVMPECNVSFYITFKLRQYKVSFVSRGEVVSERLYRLGDKVKTPKSPENYEENGYIYTFVGWTPTVSAVVNEDATYVAKFSSQLASAGNVDEDDGVFAAFFKSIALPAAAILLAIGLAVVAVIVVLDEKKNPNEKLKEFIKGFIKKK